MTWQVKTTNPEEMKLWQRLPLYVFYHLRFFYFFYFFCTLLQKPPTAGSKYACARRSYVGGDRHRYRVTRAETRSARQKNHHQNVFRGNTQNWKEIQKNHQNSVASLSPSVTPARWTPSNAESQAHPARGGLLSATAGPSWSPRLEPESLELWLTSQRSHFTLPLIGTVL